MESQQIRKVSGLFKGCPGSQEWSTIFFFRGVLGPGGTFLQRFNMIKMPHPTVPPPSNVRQNVRIQCQLVRLLLWHYQLVVRWCHGHPKGLGVFFRWCSSGLCTPKNREICRVIYLQCSNYTGAFQMTLFLLVARNSLEPTQLTGFVFAENIYAEH